MTKQDFINKQNRIYDEIQRNFQYLEQLKSAVFHNQGGYMIALRHSDVIVECVEKFNSKIEQIIPIMKYDRNNLHTTMATYQVQDNFVPDEKVLEKIVHTLKSKNNFFLPMELEYRKILMDASAMILAGGFSEEFFVNCQSIISILEESGLAFQYPWGTHITICRFIDDGNKDRIMMIREVIREMQSFIEKRAHGLKSNVPKIDVGYYKNDGRNFDLRVFETFGVSG